MGLIVRESLFSIDLNVKNVSNIFINIAKKGLTASYKLPEASIIKGVLLDIYPKVRIRVSDRKILDELKGKQMKFVLVKRKTGSYDTLFFSASSWSILREYGILPEDFEIKVKINEAIVKDNIIPIYPKRDVSLA